MDGLWTRKDLKERAKTTLRRDHWNMVFITFIVMLLMGSGIVKIEFEFDTYYNYTYFNLNFFGFTILQLTGMILIYLFICGVLFKVMIINVLEVGACRFYINASLNQWDIEDLLYGFRNNYTHIVYIQLIRDIKIFLWGCLFIIPGIVKAYEYIMIPYLLAEDSSISQNRIFDLTKSMMYGEKWNYFVLELSFLGWQLLSALTFGVAGILFVDPYVKLTYAEFYLEMKSLSYERIEETNFSF